MNKNIILGHYESNASELKKNRKNTAGNQKRKSKPYKLQQKSISGLWQIMRRYKPRFV